MIPSSRTPLGMGGALYGSAFADEAHPTWRVGLARALTLSGPWERWTARNPLPLEPTFIENPIVTPLANGGYLAVYDTGINDTHALGWAWSPDGADWERGEPIRVPARGTGGWVEQIRTPLGLVFEMPDTASIFYTGYVPDPARSSHPWGVAHVGLATVRLTFTPSST